MADSASIGPLLRWTSAARSVTGPRRAVNEDRVLDDRLKGLWAVADGMGGHTGGAEAAEAVVSALAQMTRRTSGYGRLAMLHEALGQVNSALISRQIASRTGVSGATVVALMAHDNHFACVWAGDSRAYLLRQGALRRLTHDHSLVQDLIDQGLVPEAERGLHPMAHVITRAVGVAPELRLDQAFDKIHPGDVFLLCTDGLTACISDEEIAAQLRSAKCGGGADQLLDLALSRAPKDNVSLVLVSAH